MAILATEVKQFIAEQLQSPEPQVPRGGSRWLTLLLAAWGSLCSSSTPARSPRGSFVRGVFLSKSTSALQEDRCFTLIILHFLCVFF